jgi:hypothetical protein
VQQGYAVPQNTALSASAAFMQAQTAGNTNIVAVGWNDTTSTIVSLSDSASNVYVQAVAPYHGTALSQAIYYASNIAAATAGSNHVTVKFDVAAYAIDLRFVEYSGLSAAGAFDASASSAGNGATATSTPLTTSSPHELLFAAGMTLTNFTGPGAGFTKRVITQPDSDIVEDALAPAPGAYTATAPLSSSFWLMQLATFRAAP